MPLSADTINNVFLSQADAFGLPGFAWFVREGSTPPVISSCGVRRRLPEDGEQVQGKDRGKEVPISGEEVFHWGSCSKALTSTLALILIEDAAVPLEWSTTIGETLKQLNIPTAMAAITVWQLLTHRSGLPVDLEDDGRTEAETALSEATKEISATAARMEYVRAIAKKPLVHPPGKQYGPYSNAGYTVLGAMIETCTGRSWEQLVQSKVAAPLGMSSLGFGFPPELTAHDEDGAALPLGHDDLKWHAPAYTCHATLADWARFTGMHLAALEGDKSAGTALGLREGALAVLHQPASPATDDEGFSGAEGPEGYAMGWKTQWREGIPGKERAKAEPTGVLWHYGTNFFFNSAVYMDRGEERPGGRGLLVLVASNSGSMVARLAMRMAIDSLLELSRQGDA